MATTITNTTFNTTFKDDFVDSDNFHRILFNSGRALQARELTQLQTIIQEEIRRLGSNLFVEGGVVNGSGYTVNNNYEFIKLALNQLPTDETILLNQEFIDSTGIKFKVIEVVKAGTHGPDTLYVIYTDTRAGTAGANPVRVGTNQTLNSVNTISGYTPMTTAGADVSGTGTRVSITPGSFFTQGHFVFAKEQSLIVDHYSSAPNKTIGFKIEEQVITELDDDSLFDNQGSVPNIAAPGASRYRIQLTLIDKENIIAGQSFVYLFKLVNGKITDEARTDNSYNRINDLMALRTKEESGNYIVKDFTANFELDSANTGPNIILKVSDGVAYVDGYRVESPAKDITIEKARTTTTVDNEVVRTSYGNYIDVYGGTDNKGVPDINNFRKLNLTNDSDYAGAKIGTARVRALYKEGSDTLRAYLFDINMNENQSFSTVKSIGIDSDDYMNFVLTNDQAILKNTSQNSLLFPIPRNRPSTISPDQIQVQRRYTFSTTSNTTVQNETGQEPGPGGGAGPGAGYVFTSGSQWILSDSGGNIVNQSPTNVTNNTFDYSGLAQNTNYEVLAQVSKATPSSRTKILNEVTLTKAWPTEADSDGLGTQYFNLDKADIFDIISIKVNDSDGADISDNFIFDNGQRDNFYGLGRLQLKAGRSITGSVFTRYRYFTHQAGDFFDVTSYPSATVPYDKIPNHKLNNGQLINLRDFIDFRPVAVKGPTDGRKIFDDYMLFDSNGVGGQPTVNFLPENGSTLSFDVTYFEPRIDRLIASTETAAGDRFRKGSVKVIKGTPDLNPQAPDIPSGSLPLYDLRLNAFTLNESDTTETLIPAKGFTMADISQLERRVENLEELTTLSLLEVDTTSLTVLDSAGLPRTKAGFLVDNFRNFDFSGIDRDEYRAIINENEGILEPISIPKNTKLDADSGNSTSISFKGDAAYLSVDSDVIEINQNLATETININPFAVIVSRGHTILSPETDEWVEATLLPDKVQSEGSLGTISRARLRNLLRNSFSAAAFRNQWIGRNATQVVLRGRSGELRRVLGNRVVDISVIPFMRSRIIFFKSQGLRPNTEHFMQFGGQLISDFVRQETQFKRIGGRSEPEKINSRSYINATSHPSGSSTLITDSAGELIGSFLIPSNDTLKFRTGTQKIDISDVTGDPDTATSNSSAFFQSTGILETRERTIGVSTFRVAPPPRPRDPVAQSFYVDPVEYPNGMFITEVDTFFQTKDTEGVPVECQIRTVENGFPSDRPMAGAVTFLPPSSVNIPSDLTDLDVIRNTPTTFTFDEPVYVGPGRSYAVILLAESVAYNVFVAKTYDYIIGSTAEKVNKQPTLGSLFLSQSGITWTADQTKDLMFRLKRAEFALSGTVKLQNAEPAKISLTNNPIQTDSGETAFMVLQEGHGFVAGDTVSIEGLTATETYAGVKGSTYNGNHTVTRVDHTGFMFDPGGSAANSSLSVGGSGVIISGQAMFDQFIPQINTFLPENTNVEASIVTATGSSFGSTRNIAGSTGSKVAQPSKSIVLNEFNLNETPQCIFTVANEATSPLSGAKSLKLDLTLTTNDNKVSPVIDLQRNSITTFETVLDTQDSDDFSTVNVPLTIIPETDSLAGSSAAKHVTTPVVLEEPARGLKILFAGNRPSTSKFKVFFKTATSDESLDDLQYTEISEFTNNPSDEERDVFRQYEFLPGGIGGNIPDFTKFQVKIVMIGTNTSKPPRIKDLRVLALVT